MSKLFKLKSTSVAVTLLVAALAGNVHAQNLKNYNLQAGSLSDNLARIARESGRTISAPPDLLQAKRSSPVVGNFSVEDAIRHALEGTGLELVTTSSGTLTVREIPHHGAASEATLPSVTVSAAAASPYLSDRPSSVATKTNLPPRLTPFTVNQASEEVIRERGDTTIYETLERFAGVTASSDNGDIGQGMSRSINVRGFSVSGSGQLLINGQRTYSSASSARSADNLEAVELLRGPAALYYGAAEPGGIINYNYKRPKREAAYVIRGRTDSKGSYGAMVDMTGPLNEEATLMYRAVGSFQHTKDDQNHIWSEPKSLLAAITLAPNADFSTTLTYEKLKVESVPEQENNIRITNPASPYYNQFYPVPRDFFWGSLNDRAVRDTDTLLWDMSWQQSEAFGIKASLNYQEFTQWWQNTRIQNGANGPDASGNIGRYVSGRQSAGKNYSGALDFHGKFATGLVRHDWLVGMGFGHTESQSSGRVVATQSRPGQPYTPGPINIFNPVYSDWAYRDRIWLDPLGAADQRDDRNFYLQDLIQLPNEKTRLMIAAGWSQIHSRPGGAGATPNKVSKVSPRFAVMHDVTPLTTAYVSYGESFNPQSSLTLLDMSGNYINTPQQGKQLEIGVKQDMFDGRAMLSASLFRIDKKNMPMPAQDFNECDDGAAPAPGTPGTTDGTGDCRTALNGLQRSQGVEIELTGIFTNWWNAQLAYAYLDTEYVKTDDQWALGRSMANMPRHNISLWNKFKLHQSAEYGRFDFGVGLKAWSKSHSTWRNPATHIRGTGTDYNPGYGIVDLAFFWENKLKNGKLVKIAFNINNLFDKTYYDRNRFAAGNTIVWGNERRALLSAQVSF